MPAESTSISFLLRDYLYDLPEHLIAQAPADKRENSRLLVLSRQDACELKHCRFEEITEFFRSGDLLVVNDTRVVPARLYGRKQTGGAIELLVLDPYQPPAYGQEEGYQCLLKSAKPARKETEIILQDGICAQVVTAPIEGKAVVRFKTDQTILEILDKIGHVPLPPYVRRNGNQQLIDDRVAYQTVYAAKPGAVAAPTAGLHFSRELLAELREHGVEIVTVTLHVGYGTFAPLRSEDIRDHQMHAEYVEVSAQSAQSVARAKTEGRRIIAVGTTVVRVLEWVATWSGGMSSFSGACNHYIYPGYQFKIVSGMITNFHLPGSSLLLLVSAFAGREAILHAYGQAVEHRYRFFSYGDAMLIV